jgi:hypothetical protein
VHLVDNHGNPAYTNFVRQAATLLRSNHVEPPIGSAVR